MATPPGCCRRSRGTSSTRSGAFGSSMPIVPSGASCWILRTRGIGSRSLRLAARSDILVEDFKPGYLESVGLGYEDLKAANPNLVYVSITPFGQTGPHASYLGGDLIAQAGAGMMFGNGDDERPPVMAPFEMVSQLACMHALYGAILAIRARRVIGHGQHVDVSRQEASLWAQHSYISRYSYMNQITRRDGHHSAFGAVNTYHTRDDGYVNLSIYMRHHFGRMATELMGNHPVLSDEMWWEREVRQENREVIDQLVQEYMDTVDRDDVAERGQAIGMPIVPVLSPAEFADSAHAKEREFFIDMEHPVIGSYKTAGPPLKFSKTPWAPSRTAPLLGQHTDEVLAELRDGRATCCRSGNGEPRRRVGRTGTSLWMASASWISRARLRGRFRRCSSDSLARRSSRWSRRASTITARRGRRRSRI